MQRCEGERLRGHNVIKLAAGARRSPIGKAWHVRCSLHSHPWTPAKILHDGLASTTLESTDTTRLCHRNYLAGRYFMAAFLRHSTPLQRNFI
jgi:hypothetical protein